MPQQLIEKYGAWGLIAALASLFSALVLRFVDNRFHARDIDKTEAGEIRRELREEVTELRKELRQQGDDYFKLQKDYIGLEAEHAKLRNDLSLVTAENKSLKENQAKLEAEIKALRDVISEWRLENGIRS